MQSNEFITSLRICPNCRQTCDDASYNIPTVVAQPAQDELFPANNMIVAMSPNLTSCTNHEAQLTHTSPLNTAPERAMSYVTMVNLPSILSAHSNRGSPDPVVEFHKDHHGTGTSKNDENMPIISSSETQQTMAPTEMQNHEEHTEACDVCLEII